MLNKDIIRLTECIINIQRTENIKLPIQVGYVLMKNLKLLLPTYEAIMSLKNNLIQQYGITKDNIQYIIPEDKVEFVNNELNKILDFEDTTINLLKLHLSDFNNIALSLSEIEILSLIIEED